jgi:hypothetical protein
LLILGSLVHTNSTSTQRTVVYFWGLQREHHFDQQSEKSGSLPHGLILIRLSQCSSQNSWYVLADTVHPRWVWCGNHQSKLQYSSQLLLPFEAKQITSYAHLKITTFFATASTIWAWTNNLLRSHHRFLIQSSCSLAPPRVVLQSWLPLNW